MEGSTADRRARQQERRERRSAVTDPDVVLAAGAALLGIRSRTTHELRSRLSAMGYPADLVERDHRPAGHPRLPGRRRLRAGMGRGSRPEPATRRSGVAPGAAAQGTRPGPGGRHPAATRGRSGSGRGRSSTPPHRWRRAGSAADHAAAIRLLDRRRSSLLREPDPRKRRQRAYTLLARNGFDPGVCMDVARAYRYEPDESVVRAGLTPRSIPARLALDSH